VPAKKHLLATILMASNCKTKQKDAIRQKMIYFMTVITARVIV